MSAVISRRPIINLFRSSLLTISATLITLTSSQAYSAQISLEQYIKANKHLPEIPSEAEVKENGVNVRDLNTLLLRKTDELSLYGIKQNKFVTILRHECSVSPDAWGKKMEDLALYVIEEDCGRSAETGRTTEK